MPTLSDFCRQTILALPSTGERIRKPPTGISSYALNYVGLRMSHLVLMEVTDIDTDTDRLQHRDFWYSLTPTGLIVQRLLRDETGGHYQEPSQEDAQRLASNHVGVTVKRKKGQRDWEYVATYGTPPHRHCYTCGKSLATAVASYAELEMIWSGRLHTA